MAELDQYGPWLKQEKFAAWSFRRADYLAGAADLRQAVLAKAASLGAIVSADLQVFMLTPLANFGVFFSPLTLYYAYAQDGTPCWQLAEVSNTPWNERHYYLVPLATSGDTGFFRRKNFHVSPFNPLDMHYQWQISAPAADFHFSISNWRQGEKVFSASFVFCIDSHWMPGVATTIDPDAVAKRTSGDSNILACIEVTAEGTSGVWPQASQRTLLYDIIAHPALSAGGI